jgi:transcriptional regulator GlxA family with amidase domain
LLAKAGLLHGLEATTHHGAIDLLRQTAPKTIIHADRRFVDNGRVASSAGIAAGIDMSLHVVSRLLGQEVAEKTAKQMDYPWQPWHKRMPLFLTAQIQASKASVNRFSSMSHLLNKPLANWPTRPRRATHGHDQPLSALVGG